MLRKSGHRWQGNWLPRGLVLIIGCFLVWQVFADVKSGMVRGPAIPKGKGENCIADTDFMRRDHMRLLIHQRDETVLRGLREEPFSLSECVDCHVQSAENGEHIRIDAEGQFCQSCHAYAAVKIDCFGCHAALPDLASNEPGPNQSSFYRLNKPESELLSDLATYHYGKTHTSN